MVATQETAIKNRQAGLVCACVSETVSEKFTNAESGFKIGLKTGFVPTRSADQRLQEALRLSEALGLEVCVHRTHRIVNIHPATCLTSGQVSEWKEYVLEHKLSCVVVDASLSPVQHRNLERAWNCEVIDRTRLILEIFAQRARSAEGKLQTRLALLEYERTRLVRAWTHLERQRGSLSFIGGAGESQLEIDRRLLVDQISVLKRRLAEVAKTRRVQRAGRARSPAPIVALVGYTNAGKSTLFNALTHENVMAEDMVFATLDTTLRKIGLPSGGEIFISDTVGFISNLPTSLIAAFHATLDELHDADMILHVRDVSSDAWHQEGEDVRLTLESLGIGADDSRLLEIWNKSDALKPSEKDIWQDRAEEAQAVLCSALEAEAEALVHTAMTYKLREGRTYVRVGAPHALGNAQGQAMNWLYERAEIVSREDTETGVSLHVWLSPERLSQLLRRWPKCHIEHLRV